MKTKYKVLVKFNSTNLDKSAGDKVQSALNLLCKQEEHKKGESQSGLFVA